jgi:hypothetical protein
VLNFSDLVTEVKRRATRDQSGTTFDDGIKTAINSSLFRISRESPWRPMRRKTSFNTITSYTTGSGFVTVTSNSNLVTVSGATLVTDAVNVDRYIKFSGSSKYYIIKTISGETTLSINESFRGVTSTSNTYEIMPQGTYNLPMQSGHRMFMWHEEYGYPFKLRYITDQDFFGRGMFNIIKYPSTAYKMWGEDMVITQLKSDSNLSVSSSSSGDTGKSITIFGTVNGYPDYEVINTNASNGTTAVTGANIFTSIERISKASSTTGRITVTANSGNTTVAVIPTGDTVAGVLYKKIQLYPLPNRAFPIFVQYYKDPFRLVNDGDVHELGQEFDEAIILWATAKVKAEADQAEADRFMLLALDELRSLKKTNVDKIDWFPNLRKPTASYRDKMVGGLFYGQVGGTGQYGESSYR